MKNDPGGFMKNDSEILDLSQPTICEWPDEPHDPYTIIPNALIRDESISPNCRWLICYLLSNAKGWVINLSQVWKHASPFMGRDKVRKLFREAIDAGYILKHNSKRGNLNHVIYYVSKSAKFKKSFRQPENQSPGDKAPEDQPIKNNIYKKEHKKEVVSEAALRLTDFFFGQLKEINPKIKVPNIDKWTKEIQRIMTVDERTEEELIAMITYIVKQHYNPKKEFTWSKAVMSPEKLRKHFAAIWYEMNTKTDSQKKEDVQNERIKTIEENKKWAQLAWKTHNLTGAEDVIFEVKDTCVWLGSRRKNNKSILGFGENGFRAIVEKFLRQYSIL